jgi:hypothetical protein
MAGPFDYQQPSTNSSTVRRKLFSKSNTQAAAILSIDENPFTEAQILAGPTYAYNSVGGNYGFLLGSTPSNTTYSIGSSGGILSTATLPSSENWNIGTIVGSRNVVIASGTNKAAYSSDSGVTYSASTLPSSSSWSSITGSIYTYYNMVVVANGSASAAYSNNGGATWSTRTLPTSANWSSCSGDSNRFIAVASGGTSATYSANEAVTWSAATLPSSANWIACYITGATACAISTSGAAAYSSDYGATWTAKTLPAGPANWVSMSAYGTNVIAIASDSATYAYSSNCGSTWSTGTLPSSKSWAGIILANSSKWMIYNAVGDQLISGSIYSGVPTTFTAVTTNLNYVSSVTSLAYGNGIFMYPPAGSDTKNPKGAYSSDGINWTLTGTFIADATYGSNYIDIAYGNSRWVALGRTTSLGTYFCAYSTNNGATWTTGGDMTIGGTVGGGTLNITYGNGLFVVSGTIQSSGVDEGVITSPDGVTWTFRTVQAYTGRTASPAVYGNGYFILSYSSSGVIYTNYRSTDGITWVSAPVGVWNKYSVTPAKTKGYLGYSGNSFSSTYQYSYLTLYNGDSATSGTASYPAIRTLPLPVTYYGSAPYVFSSIGANVVINYSSELGLYLCIPTPISTTGSGISQIGYLSDNGLNWFNFNITNQGYFTAIASGNGIFVAILNGTASGVMTLVSNTSAQSLILPR